MKVGWVPSDWGANAPRNNGESANERVGTACPPYAGCLPAQGTFYAFALFKDAMASFEGITNDVDMAELILNEAGVALVPGSAFGAEGYMRLSFATSPEKLDQALDRIEKLLGRADV
jgi:aspartate/methionine/tyrosine aminotransferase